MTALAGGLANTLTLPAYFTMLRRRLNVDLLNLGRDLMPIWIAGIVMVAGIVIARHYVLSGLPPLTVLILSIVLGIVLFAGVISMLRRDYADELVTMIKGKSQSGSPS
jgi:hypothetical protein